MRKTERQNERMNTKKNSIQRRKITYVMILCNFIYIRNSNGMTHRYRELMPLATILQNSTIQKCDMAF